MPLWGHTSGTESKPNWLSASEKTNTSAKAHGWELKKVVGSRTLTETLVAWSSSALTTALGAADITDIDWNITAFDKSEGGTLSVKVVFNEAVDVTGTPQLTVVNDQRANHTLSYASGTGSNELTFTIGANAVALNGGTIKDKGTATASTITSVAGIGTAAGTITVAA
jgi:hypothetical protein